MELILVRHGESEHNVHRNKDLDSKLTQKGLGQAHEVAKRLSKFPDIRDFKAFTSPFQRCLTTSQIISDRLDLPFEVIDLISEYTKNYPQEGCKVPNRSKRYKNFIWNSKKKVFHYEDPKDLVKRAHDALDFLPNKALVVSHGTPVMTMGKIASGENLEVAPKWDDSIGNCSITYIKDGKVICWGDDSSRKFWLAQD